MVVKTINIIFLALLLLSPCVNLWSFDARILDFQAVYLKLIIWIFAGFTIGRAVMKNKDTQLESTTNHKCIQPGPAAQHTHIRLNETDGLMIALLAILLIRLFFSDIFSVRNELLLWCLSFLLLYISLRSMDSPIPTIERTIAAVFPLLGLFFSSYGLLQFAGLLKYSNPFFRMGGPFANPALFSCFLSLLLPVLINQIIYPKAETTKAVRIKPVQTTPAQLFAITSAVLCFIVILLTGERSSWIAVFISTMIVAGNKIRRSRFGRIWASMSVTRKALIVLVIATVAIVALYQLRASSALGRMLIYKNTLTIIRQHLLFGIGPGKFPSVYPFYQAAWFKSAQHDNSFVQVADNVAYAFNDYLQFFCEAGLPALLLILVGLWYIGRAISNPCNRTYSSKPSAHPDGSADPNNMSIGVAGALSSLALIALFSYPLRDPVMMTFGLILFSTVRSSKNRSVKITLQPVTRIVLLTAFFLAATGVAWLTISGTHARYQWKAIANSQDDPQGRLQKYARLDATLDDDAFFLYNYGVELSLNGSYAQSIPLLEKAQKYYTNSDLEIYLGDDYLGVKQYEKAKEKYEEATAMVPKRVLPKYALMQFYQAIHNEQKADSLALTILTEKVIYPSPEIDAIRDQAVEALKNCK